MPTVRKWLSDWFDIQRVEGAGGRGLSPGTANDYESIIRDWIAPTDLGGMRLDHVGAENVRDWLTHLRTTPVARPRRRADGSLGTTLSPHRQLCIWRVLRHAMTDAVVAGYVTADPMMGISPPSIAGDARRQAVDTTHTASAEQARAMDKDDLRRVGAYLSSVGCQHEKGVCELRWLLALVLGLRQGEALGLGWRSVDLSDDAPVVHIVRHLSRVLWLHGEDCEVTDEVDDDGEPLSTCGHVQGRYCTSRQGGGLRLLPGTKAGVDRTRSLGLDEHLVTAFRTHKKAQDAELRLMRRKGTHDPLDPSHAGLVFTSLPHGRAMSPTADTQAWRRVLTGAGVTRHYRVHDARHTAATLIVNSAIDLASAQQVLGHAQIATTARYVWTDVSATRRAVTAASGALRALHSADPASGR